MRTTKPTNNKHLYLTMIVVSVISLAFLTLGIHIKKKAERPLTMEEDWIRQFKKLAEDGI